MTITESLPQYKIDIQPKPGVDSIHTPLQEAYDFSQLAPKLRGKNFFRRCHVAYRFVSTLKQDADIAQLTQLDHAAEIEANSSGKLEFYLKGNMNDKRENVSFCIWKNKKAAQKTSQGPEHRKAMGAAREMYEPNFKLERYWVTKSKEKVIFTPMKENKLIKKLKKVVFKKAGHPHH